MFYFPGPTSIWSNRTILVGSVPCTDEQNCWGTQDPPVSDTQWITLFTKAFTSLKSVGHQNAFDSSLAVEFVPWCPDALVCAITQRRNCRSVLISEVQIGRQSVFRQSPWEYMKPFGWLFSWFFCTFITHFFRGPLRLFRNCWRRRWDT